VNTESSTRVPAILIRVEFEATAPKVIADYTSESEAAHLCSWLNEQPDLLLLVARALELAEEVRAS
jgi:hypothetical protein